MDVEFRFGRFTLDAARRELRHDGSRVHLEAASFRILLHLVQNRARAVSRVELLDLVWPNVHVSPASLDTAIYQLRNALRAADPSAHPIETLRGYGFLFGDPVEVRDRGDPRSAAEDAEAERSGRDRQLLDVYASLTSEGLWCFELTRPMRASLPDPALIEGVMEHGVLSFCNENLARTYGYEQPSELIGRGVTDFLLPDQPENLEYLRDVIRRRSVRGALSLEVDRSGTLRWISNNVVLVSHGDEFVRICGTQRDVTAWIRPRTEGPGARECHPAQLVPTLVTLEKLGRALRDDVARGAPGDAPQRRLAEVRERASRLVRKSSS